METSKIVLLDLRGSPGDQPAEISGGVVVLDDAGSLIKHADLYMSLVAEEMVTGIVCVAVGESTTDSPPDGAVLAVPPVLRYTTVLWVGDERGVDWAPEHSAPRPADGEPDALDALVAALRVPEVFDRVVALTGDRPGLVTGPGIRLVSVAVDPGELAEIRAAAVRSLCKAGQPASQALDAAVRQVDAVHEPEGAVLSGPVAAAAAEATRRLNEIDDLARLLGTWKGVLGARRPTERLGERVTGAGQAAETYRLHLVELLDRMDSHLEIGRPAIDSVVEMGVQRPREARGAEVASGIKSLVEARLDGGTPLSVLAQELRSAAAASSPQGCAAALDEVRRRGPLALTPPAFRRWPLGLLTLPLMFLGCALLALLLGPGVSGWLGGGTLAAGWFGVGWLLMSRRPGLQAETAPATARVPALLMYGGPSFLGAIGGAVLAGRRPGLLPVSPLIADILSVVVVLGGVGVAALSWRSAAHRWAAELPLQGLRRTLADLTRLAEEATAREWQPMCRRRAIASSAGQVGAALDEIVAGLEEVGDRLFLAPASGSAGSPPSRPVPPELYGVVRGDLADLCRSALSPVWSATGGTRVTPAGVFARRLKQLLDEYGAHVRSNGLMTTPAFGLDPGPRDALTARVWSETPESLTALRTGADGEMTQLCRSGQLRYLSTATEPVLIRFAPSRLRRILDEGGTHQRLAADPGVTWTHGSELVGAVRLLPLRAESVRQVLGGGF
ncbi:hypothetical protein AB0F15_00545 [Amycolatopsis sp. NPDC026612]|uniref:hypothetical protein n=1 Tax=Amycolatopsis sp. NPDC026612 TaxID=3155466 RepID=UPI0034035494